MGLPPILPSTTQMKSQADWKEYLNVRKVNSSIASCTSPQVQEALRVKDQSSRSRVSILKEIEMVK
jgi:hypothetical protein